jgi:hypothetical protein
MLTKAQAVMYGLKLGIPSVRILKASDAAQAIENSKVGTRCCLDFSATTAPLAFPRETSPEDLYASV